MKISSMKKIFIFGICFTVFFLITSTNGVAQNVSPFGVCSHLQGGEEHNQMPANLRMMKEAGIKWVRLDFSWGSVEPQQGVWRFDHLDRVVEEAEKHGIGVLALLLYDRPWAKPVFEHLDTWLTYVEKIVTRYKDRVHLWEVWNEPDLFPRFWDKRDDPENYALLLKTTHKKIKEIDPRLTVVHAGTAGIPMSYIERSFKAGAVFDKMAVHPYRSFLTTWEQTLRYKDDIEKLQALMTKYKLGSKDVWFTEMGVSSMATVAVRGKDVFHETKAETGKDWKVAVVCDDDFPVDPSFTQATLRSFFPAGFKLDTIQILNMRRVRLTDYDAVFFPPSDNIPLHVSQTLTPYLTSYMRNGGKIYYYTREGNMFYYGDAAEKENLQAIYAAQTMWLALRFGVEKYFWYEFESPERNIFDREDNFGLTRRGLSPKRAYRSYATMGMLFPEGSKIDTSVEWRQKDCCVVTWKQPDGTRVWAVWSPEGEQKVNVRIGKGLRQTFSYLGNPVSTVTESSRTLDVGPGVIYLVGSESLVIQ